MSAPLALAAHLIVQWGGLIVAIFMSSVLEEHLMVTVNHALIKFVWCVSSGFMHFSSITVMWVLFSLIKST